MTEKPILNSLFRQHPDTPEGKYLVKRRDGSVPPWPHFVLGGADPAAEHALHSYANKAHELGYNPGFVAGVRQWANEFAKYRAEHGNGDPDRGKHREDDPATIAEMKKGFSA